MTVKTLKEFEKAHSPSYQSAEAVPLYRPLNNPSRYLIVSVQNATPLHKGFWAVLQRVSKELNAELLLIPIRYKNPTSQWVGSQSNAEWWAPETREFLWNKRHDLNQNLLLLADMKIQPAASNPLSGADSLSAASSGIVGHPRLQMKTIAVPRNKTPKIMMTSGACTVPNYTDSRQGRLGQFHHSISCVLVEIKGAKFFARRLQYCEETQSVIDLGVHYDSKRKSTAPRSLALIMGDTHVDHVSAKVEKATFGEGGIVERTRPQHLIWHDLLNGGTISKYNNILDQIANMLAHRSSAKEEVDRAIDYVRAHTPPDTMSVIVVSNHNDWLKQWVLNHDWRHDPKNAKFYLETALAMVNSTSYTNRGTECLDPFAYWFRKVNLPNVRVLEAGESFSLGGWELALHGHKGIGGRPGTRKGLSHMGTKSIIGHRHSPGEEEGCRQVGTSTELSSTYASDSPSDWLNAHADLNADAKTQIIIIPEGEFCL